MNHLIHKIEAYARHYQLEQAGHTNQADAQFSAVYDALAAHTEAVSRSSVVAYREGLLGVPFNHAYTQWEIEAWNSGRKDRG